MSKQYWLRLTSIVVLLESILLYFTPVASLAAEPVRKGDHFRSPIQFTEVGRPVHPEKPGRRNGGAVIYTPANIQQAYNFGAFAGGGAGQHIAIVDAYGDRTIVSDLASFNSRFNLPAATLNVWYSGGTPGNNRNWAMETAMDVEWAHASAPYAVIDLVVAPDASLASMLNAVKYAGGLGVTAISMSFGLPESYLDATTLGQWETAFAGIASKGITLLASSGDQGAYDGTSQLNADYPASSQYVIGVGGTTLKQSSLGIWGETAWSGSGGGYSADFSEPSYQTTANITDVAHKRGVPDVAFDADPNTGVYVCSGGLWYAVGGTSLGAPNWAAIVADNTANGAHALNLGYLYQTVYGANGGSALYGTEIRDVTGGNNGYYSASAKWDAVTGIGTPNVSNLITAR